MTVNDWEPQFTQRFKGTPTYRDGDRSGGMWWPAGTFHIPNEGLRHRLVTSGQWHARTALHQFADDMDVDRQLQAAISTGTAVELTLKAYLVGIAPALIADKSSKDSILMLAGQGALASAPARGFKSILAGEALTTVRSIVKGFPKTPQHLEAFAVRNAACHMALVEAEQLRLAAVEMVKVIEALLPLLQLSRERYWGTGALSVANALMTKANTELQHRFEAKLAAAKREVYRLTLSLGPDAKVALLAALAARLPDAIGDVGFPAPCPACEQRGTLFCIIEELEVDGEVDDRVLSVSAPTAYPIAFICTACALTLNDEELVLADLHRVLDEPASGLN